MSGKAVHARLASLALAAALALGLASSASGLASARRAVFTWGGPGNWSVGANWSGGVVPGPGDVATFSGSNSCTIDVAVNVQGIDIQAGYTGTISTTTDSGLWGDYYDGEQFNFYMGSYLDATVDFPAADGPLGTNRAGGPDTFTVRWRGQVLTTGAGAYTFSTNTDDGSRLWVNGVQVINDWTLKPPTQRDSQPITLAAATWYDIQLEMFERGGGAAIQLLWTPPGGASGVIPTGNLRSSPPIRVGVGTLGLRGDYYQSPNSGASPPPPPGSLWVAGTSVATATQEPINFTEGGGWPPAGGPDGYSVRWTGTVDITTTGFYRFAITTEDGGRLWIDPENNGSHSLIINSWFDRGATTDIAPAVWLTSGQVVGVIFEMYNNTGTGRAALEWIAPGGSAPVPIPAANISGTGLSGEYFDLATPLPVTPPPPPPGSLMGPPTGGAVLTRIDATVDFDFNATPPGGGVRGDDFTVRWTGSILTTVAGDYTIEIETDDGVRVWVDTGGGFPAAPQANFWVDRGPTTNSFVLTGLAATTHYAIAIDYYENGGGAVARLRWIPPGGALAPIPMTNLAFPAGGSTGGLQGEYFNSADTGDPIPPPYPTLTGSTAAGPYSGTLTMSRIDPQVNYNWGGGGPGAPLAANDFGVRWTGQVFADTTGTYTFTTRTDDGTRLWVNSTQLVNQWIQQGMTDHSGTIFLTGGTWNDVVFEMYENEGGAGAILRYTPPAGVDQVIPSSYLRHVAGAPGIVGFAQAAGTFNANLSSVYVANTAQFASAYTLSGGTFSSSGTLTVYGNAAQTGGTLIASTADTIDVNGNLNISGVGSAFSAPAGVLEVSGAFTHSAGPLTPNGGTVVLNSPTNQTLTVSAGTSFSNLAISDGMVGYWKLDEAAGGTSAADASGTGNQGVLMPAPPANGPGVILPPPGFNFTNRQARSFDGVDDFISTSYDLNQWLGGTGSLACWIRTTQAAPAVGVRYWNWPGVSGVENAGDSNDFFWGTLGNGDAAVDNSLLAGAIGIQSGNGNRAETLVAVTDGQWHHVAFTRNATTGALQCYLDGVFQSQVTGETGQKTTPFSSIGRVEDTGNSPVYFQGDLDDVRMYNRVLTAQEVQALAIGNQPGIATSVQTLAGGPLAVTGNLLLNAGGLDAGAQNIAVGGSWLNHGGVFTGGTSTVTLNATTAQAILSGGQRFNNLTLNGVAGVWSLEDRMNAAGTLTLTNGTLDVTTANYTVHAGTVSQGAGGTLQPRTGTVVLDSTANVTFNFLSNPNNLRIEDPTEANLVGYWKLDQGNGTVARDSSPTGANGALTNTPFWNDLLLPAPIRFDNVHTLAFDGVDDYVDLGNPAALNLTTAITVSAWVNISASAAEKKVVAKWADTPAADRCYLLSVGGAGGNQPLFAIHDSTDTPFIATSAVNLLPGTWTHVAGTFDGTNVRIYVNGVQTGISAITGTIRSSAAPVRIGMGSGTPPAGEEPFQGGIDDVRIYDRAITSAEALRLAGGGYVDGCLGTATFSLGGPLTVGGAFSIDSGVFNANGNAATFTGPVVLQPGDGCYTASTATQTFNGGLTVNGGGFTGSTGLVDVNGNFLLGGGTFTAPSTTMTVSGNFAAMGTPTFSANGGTITFDGTANQGFTTGGLTYNNITVSNTGTSPTNLVTLAGNLTATAVTVANGALVQAADNINVGTLTVNAAGVFTNTSTGDITLGTGGIVNNGIVVIDGGGGGCGSPDDIVITSSFAGQAPWSGTGAWRVEDVTISNQNALVPITLYDSTIGVGVTGFTPAGCGTFTIIVTPSATPLVTSETPPGGPATFNVRLGAQPISNVTFAIVSSDTTEGTVSATTLTFTSANWDTDQTVTVTGVDDPFADGNISYTISIGPAVTFDPDYAGDSGNPVSAVNMDDDIPGFLVNPTFGLLTTELGGTATFTIRLTTQPTDVVTISLASSDPTEGTVAPPSFTFTTGNWNTPQTATVTGVPDGIADGNQNYVIITSPASSADTVYNGMDPTDVFVTNVDNDSAGITVVPAGGLITTEGGGTATFSVVLNTQPAVGVVIGLNSSDTTEGTIVAGSLTFTTANWNTPQTVTVTGQPDGIADGNQSYSIVTAPASAAGDAAYDGLDPSDVSLVNLDNSGVGISVFPASGLVTSETGGRDFFRAVLNTQPTSNVTVNLSSSATAEGVPSPTSVTFTTANWNQPQMVTVTGLDDFTVDGNVAYVIATAPATSSDTNYNGVDAADVQVTNLDDDIPLEPVWGKCGSSVAAPTAPWAAVALVLLAACFRRKRD